MSDTGLLSELEELFHEAGTAHHRSFIESNGEDPEWPLWYADYLYERLANRLTAPFTKSEFICLLLGAEQERMANKRDVSWQSFYATFFMDRCGPMPSEEGT